MTYTILPADTGFAAVDKIPHGVRLAACGKARVTTIRRKLKRKQAVCLRLSYATQT